MTLGNGMFVVSVWHRLGHHVPVKPGTRARMHGAWRAGGIGVTMHGMWSDPFEMRLWGMTSCCVCL